jgi:hypothetical protein
VNDLHRRATLVFGLVAIGLGCAILVVTATHGGGSVGYLMSALFTALGVGRLYLVRRR